MKAVLFLLTLISLVPTGALHCHDVIILDESVHLNILGTQSVPNGFELEKEVLYQPLTGKGLEELTSMTLPDEIDPTYFDHVPDGRPYYYHLNGYEFTVKAEIVKDNKTVRTLPVNKRWEFKQVYSGRTGKYGQAKVYYYTLPKISVDEVLKITYKLRTYFWGNEDQAACLRWFFHGRYFKKHTKFTLTYPQDYSCKVKHYNGAEPHQSILLSGTYKDEWQYVDLNGALSEKGGRPHKELPYVVFLNIPLKTWFTLKSYGTYDITSMAYPSFLAGARELENIWVKTSLQVGSTSKQFNLFRHFMEGACPQYATRPQECLDSINAEIADNFVFDNDQAYYSTTKNEDEAKIGDECKDGVLRDISRYKIYTGLMAELDIPYFTAYIADNRIGEIDEVFVKPIYQGDYLILPETGDGKVRFLYPKKSRGGFYVNELPFYFEDTSVLLFRQKSSVRSGDGITNKDLFFHTPASSSAHNTRSVNAMVNLSIGENKAEVRQRIVLRGQFSTMTRGLYLHDEKLPRINPKYHEKAWDIEGAELLNQPSITTSTEYPFQTQIDAAFTVSGLVSERGDTLEARLHEWVKYIYEPGVDSSNRSIAFYPDFAQRDNFTFLVQTDIPVELLDQPEVVITNAYGSFMLMCQQTGPTTIKVSTSFLTDSKSVPAEKTGGVQQINGAMEKVSQLTLQFRKA